MWTLATSWPADHWYVLWASRTCHVVFRTHLAVILNHAKTVKLSSIIFPARKRHQSYLAQTCVGRLEQGEEENLCNTLLANQKNMLSHPNSKQWIGCFALFFPYRFSVKIFFIACHSIAPRAVLAKSAVPVPAPELVEPLLNPVILTGP